MNLADSLGRTVIVTRARLLCELFGHLKAKKNKNNKKKTVSETVSLWAWKRVPFLKETPRPCKTVEAGQKGCLLSILSFSVMPRPWQLAAVHRGLILALGRQTLYDLIYDFTHFVDSEGM